MRVRAQTQEGEPRSPSFRALCYLVSAKPRDILGRRAVLAEPGDQIHERRWDVSIKYKMEKDRVWFAGPDKERAPCM